MLGNIKFIGKVIKYTMMTSLPIFIGELFKLGVLHEAIVHQCIKEVGVVLCFFNPLITTNLTL